MTEEAKTEVQNEPEAKQPVADPVEALASEIGWNKDYDGEDAVDAKTFIARGKEINRSISKKVKNLSRQLEAMQQGLSAMKSHYESAREREVSRLTAEIDALKQERDAAVDEGDPDSYKRVNAKLEKLTGEVEKVKIAPAPQSETAPPPPEYVKWVEAGNEWYEEDTEMRVWANSLAGTPEYKALPYPRLLNALSKKAKEIFPDKFEEQPEPEPKRSAASVAAPTNKSKSKERKATASDLNHSQRQAGQDFVAQGVYSSLDEYAQSLADYERKNAR